MSKVITARRADTCCDPACESTAIAAGTQINYGGPGAVTHESCTPLDAPRRNSGRGGYRRSSYYTRCNHEDYPCCGC